MLLTVVLPVHGVEPYLARCLDSVLGSLPAERAAELEVVAVDDCSPDGSGAILDAYAARDRRLRVVHLDRNVGLGEARNRGLREASGDYVWFVDSDDWLADGAVPAVLDRLERSRPDVLVVDFALAYPDGSIERDRWERLFREPPPPDVFRLAERPSLFQLIMTAWNKVVRREFLLGLGVAFGGGFYEDLSVTYPVLMAAERIALLDRVCYHYRRDRPGAITGTTSERHVDIFGQYGRAFAFLDSLGPAGEPFRRPLFDRTVRHSTTVFGTPGLVPRGLRRAFFTAMSRHFRRFRPPRYRYPAGVRGVQYRLVERDAYRPYLALQALSRVRLALRRAGAPGSRGVLARRIRTAAAIAYYRACTLLPVDDRLAVYAAYWYGGYACNPRAIYEKAGELAPGVRGVWVVRRDRVGQVPAGVDVAVAGTARSLRVLATARYLVNNVNFPHEIAKRKGSIRVQTQHGTPLKTLGLDLRDYPAAAAGMNFERLVEHCGTWDFLVSPNRYSTEVWTRVYPGRYEVLEVGYPRNDRFFGYRDDEVASIRASLGVGPERTAVLYAPTFREGQRQAVPTLDVARLAAALGPGYVLLMRAHYFFDGFGAESAGAGSDSATVVDVTGHPRVEDLCLAADVLLTDYSSIMFDYANLDRPIVIYAPDWDDYRATRGVYFDLLAEPPGAVATTEDELVACFRSGGFRDEAAGRARAAFRERFCSLEDGQAAERVVRRVLLGELPVERSGRVGG